MKKIVLLLFLIISVAACGSYKADVKGETYKEFALAGDFGTLSLPPSAFDITPTQNFLTADSLKGVAWEIVENTGGDGNIQVAHTAEGADCAGVPPTETIPILAGQLSSVYTPFQPSTITTINNLLNGYGSFRVCFTVNNLSGSQPLNVRLRLKINSAGKVGVGM